MLFKKIERIKEKLIKIGLMHPGSLRPQYNICGTPGCRCKDPHDPKKHGPYYNLSFTFQGKNSTKFIREALVEDFKDYTANYRQFQELLNELLDLNIQVIESRRKK